MDQRKLITTYRIFKNGGQGFIRNASLSIAAIAVMLITLSIALFSIVANATLNNTVTQLTDKIDVSIYLKDTVTEEQRNQLIADLRALPNTKSIDYVSKDRALELYKQANVNNPDLLDAISQTDNPLPASLQLKPKDPNKIQDIKNYLEKTEIKELQSDETSYSGDRKEAIDKITGATKFFRQAGIVGIVIFTLVSMLIIFNTIRMTIFNRRDELQIMRLLGASTAFIRGPFVVETVLYGIVAAILSVALLDTFFRITAKTLEANNVGLLDINFAAQFFQSNFFVILTAQLGIGILIGAVSSMIATRRYLKFKTSK